MLSYRQILWVRSFQAFGAKSPAYICEVGPARVLAGAATRSKTGATQPGRAAIVSSSPDLGTGSELFVCPIDVDQPCHRRTESTPGFVPPSLCRRAPTRRCEMLGPVLTVNAIGLDQPGAGLPGRADQLPTTRPFSPQGLGKEAL